MRKRVVMVMDKSEVGADSSVSRKPLAGPCLGVGTFEQEDCSFRHAKASRRLADADAFSLEASLFKVFFKVILRWRIL